MKKLKTRLIPFIFLAVASLAAYSYLSTATPHNQTQRNAIYSAGQDTPEEQDLYLPDVEMVNKLLEAGKKLRAFGL